MQVNPSIKRKIHLAARFLQNGDVSKAPQMVSEPVLRFESGVNGVRSEKAPLLALVPPTEQLGSLRKAHRNPFSEPRVEQGPYVSLQHIISDAAII